MSTICKMLKVAEAVKSFLIVVQKLELYVNIQYVYTYITICTVTLTHILHIYYTYFCFECNK